MAFQSTSAYYVSPHLEWVPDYAIELDGLAIGLRAGAQLVREYGSTGMLPWLTARVSASLPVTSTVRAELSAGANATVGGFMAFSFVGIAAVAFPVASALNGVLSLGGSSAGNQITLNGSAAVEYRP